MSNIEPSNQVVPVPETLNPTEVVSPRYVKLIERYNHFSRKVAEDVIELAKIILYAGTYLDEDELNLFCAEVRLPKDSSTWHKMKKIGEKATRFKPFIGQQPGNWTTLHGLAALKDDAFDRVTKSDRFCPSMTAHDLASILQIADPKTKGSRDVVIDLCALPKKQKVEMVSRLEELGQEYGFAVEPSKEIRKLVANNAASSPEIESFLDELLAKQ